MPEPTATTEWKKTACILCACNCGLEVQTDAGHIVKVRGDAANPVSKGYLCEKAQRIDHYQNGADRLTAPQRRRPDGTYEAIDWDTAIREIAAKLNDIRQRHGGESIFFYGGGAQGNHLGGTYIDALLKALGSKYRSNGLAQEKTGEFWVQGKMIGAGVHGDYEHAEVAVFLGKNPWHSHGFARARAVLREIARDPRRKLVVIDPRRSETAAMADLHLAPKPGTDAWLLAAALGVLVQEDLVKRDWLAAHTRGYEAIEPRLRAMPVAAYAEVCGVPEAQIRDFARLVAGAASVSMYEDLGVQMNRHSTLVSYLDRLVWLLTGHYGRQGTANAIVPFLSLSAASQGTPKEGRSVDPAKRKEKRSPVTGSKIIIGLVPCNVITEEILTDHPKRFRAMIVQAGNPVHSLADSAKMREAMRALELSVVIDVAMTETAREADYVLPTASQFEKAEATFFNLEITANAFHLRRPLFAPRPGTLPEAEIAARLVEALGALGERDYAPLRLAARFGLAAYAAVLGAMTLSKRSLDLAPLLVYRSLGPRLPAGLDSAAVVFPLCLQYVLNNPRAASRAGYGMFPLTAGVRLFEAMLAGASGTVFARSTYEDSWAAVGHPGRRINLAVPELFGELDKLAAGAPQADPAFPYTLSAGERRSDTANTLVRDASWHAKGRFGTLRIHPADAAALGVADRGRLRVVTRRGSAVAEVEVTDQMQRGHVSLPNGQGLDYPGPDGRTVRRGLAPNELTDLRDRDFLAGTPWHKGVAARLEPVG